MSGHGRTTPRPYACHAKALLTLAEAARQLEISRQTLIKWADLGYITFTTIGPPQSPIRRVHVSEVQRLKKTA